MKRGKLIHKLGIAAGTLVLCLLALELYARRTYEPPLDFSDVEPFAFGEEFTPRRNRFKFREGPIEPELFEEDFARILVLGDSFTFGFGVRDGDERFTERVEARLNAEAGVSVQARRYHLFNAGVSGTGPTEWVEHWKLLRPEYRPTHVVAVFFLRCGTSLGTSLKFYGGQIERIKAKHQERFLYEHSFLARSVLDGAITREFTDWYKQRFKDAYLGDEAQTARWAREKAKLLELRDLCAADGVELALVIFPLLLDLEEYGFGPVEAEIAGFADGAGIGVFSLIEGFAGREARSLWVSANDQHPNALGHRIAAETLYPYVVERFGFAAR